MSDTDYLETLSIEEKIHLLEGNGNWNTFDANGKIPSISMSDGPHGLRKQTESSLTNINESITSTCFPTASAIASSWNVNALKEMGKAIALEAHSQNVNLLLGPGINIKRSPLCGRNFEYFSEDPYLTGKLASAYVEGLQESGIGSCVKHFACNNQEERRQTSSSIIDERTLNEIYLRAFEIVIKNSKPMAIMGSYNKINGIRVCQNKLLINEVLRKKWGYKGFVVSDWGACVNPVESLKAGLDLAMPDSKGYFFNCIKKGYEEGEISEKEIDLANKRIISAAKKLNDDHIDIKPDFLVQHETALKLAEESAVLLRNNSILPIQSDKVVVIGEFSKSMKIQGAGSSHVNSIVYPNVIESLIEQGIEVSYEPDLKNAVNQVQLAAFKNIPVLYFCGLPEDVESEGFDRTNIQLPKEQTKILKQILEITNNVVIFCFSGSPVDFSFIGKAKGLVQMYLCGEAAGEACANIITGKINPSGHLAETFPIKIEDSPCFDYFGTKDDSIVYKENVFVGYRHYETYKIPVAFEFGKGLSYTKFEYKDLKVKLPKVSFKITNVGDYDGAEVPQVYVVNPQLTDVRPIKQIRPLKELVGFDKVFLKCGETKNVEIILDDKIFSIYDVNSKDFIKIGGTYKIQVGASIKDIKLTEEIEVQGPDIEDVIEKDYIKKFFNYANYEEKHKRGEFTVEDSITDLSRSSLLLKLIRRALLIAVSMSNKGKRKNDSNLKIALSFVKESPVVALVSVTGGRISYRFVNLLVIIANKEFIKNFLSFFSKKFNFHKK